MLNVPERTSPPAPHSNGDALMRWLAQVIELPQLRIKPKLRGNHLYVLCEGASCPEQAIVVSRLTHALTETPLTQFWPNAVIDQIIVYGRAYSSPRPDWAEVIPSPRRDADSSRLPADSPRPADSLRLPADSKSCGQAAPTHLPDSPHPTDSQLVDARPLQDAHSFPSPDPHILQQARQGDLTAIAQCLSATLSHLGIAVRVQLKPGSGESEAEGQRLLVLCESHYSPEASLIAPAIAQKLRELQLSNCRSALVFGQVQGETQPEWTLQVDLTPPGEMLREWARWGDVGALSRLLNRVLVARQVKVSVKLLETTLHITCRSKGLAPEKVKLRSVIAALLETLAPQGIHSATVYGVGKQAGKSDAATATAPDIAETPTWVDWLPLPAAENLELTAATLTVAQRGNLGAIAFLLTRLLNPNLKTYLATGGTRIQLRRKSDLLHIMADALICPQQTAVTTAIAQFLAPLKIPGITGIRVYGRRAGQTRPLWNWAQDFETRPSAPRQVAEATPEFAASDAYVGDLLGTPGELVWQPDAQLVWQPDDQPQIWQEWLHQAVEAVQRVLIQTQLFVHATPNRSLTATEPDAATIGQGVKVALVWGTLGLLLTLQTDWILGQVIRANASPRQPVATLPPAEETTTPLPTLSLKKSERVDKSDQAAFNGSSFTQSGRAVIAGESTRHADGTAKPLLAAPLQQKAIVDSNKSPYPTLNAKQLDEKLILYRQYVAKNGAPDILITGSSRAMRGIDPAALQKALAAQGYAGLKIFNFGVNGSTAQVENLILRRLFATERLPKLILWADGSRALNSGRLDVTYNAIAASPGYKKLPAEVALQPTATPTASPVAPVPVSSSSVVADSYQTVNLWLDQTVANISTAYPQREQLKTLLQGKLLAPLRVTGAIDETAALVPQDGKGLIDVNGFLPLAVRFNPATYYQKYSRVNGVNDGDYADFRLDGAQTEALAAIAQFTQEHKIPLVFVNLPLTKEYLDPIRQGHEDEFQRYMIQASGEMGFTFRNLADLFTAENDFFSDPSHLNRYGAFAVSNQIAKDALIPWSKR